MANKGKGVVKEPNPDLAGLYAEKTVQHPEIDGDVRNDSRHVPLNSSLRVEERTLPCGHKIGGRNLVVCIDGTANQFGDKNTNVIEIYNLIMKETCDRQRTWYNSGIGTYARPHWRSPKYWRQVVYHKIDLAIAWNFEKTVQAAYRWLSDNYEDGDCIFLFGFSRGAFQVRALSAMIHKVGLIHKGNEAQIPFAYELYADPKSDDMKINQVGSADEKVSMAQRFKEAFSRRNVRVHFVGAWDTVSSIGVARGKRTLPGTTDGMTHVCYFRHALALDERRVKFLPEYAWGGATLCPPQRADDAREEDTRHGDRILPHTLEIWFPGTHSDIGGGNTNNERMDRSRPPLRWMVSQAKELGLRIRPFKRELLSSEQIEFRESLKGLWHFFEIIPFRRLTFARTGEINDTTRRPHFWKSRKIHEGQKIHYSLVLGKTERPYIPKARPPSNPTTFWNTLRTEPLQNSTSLLEIETFYRGAEAVKRILSDQPTDEVVRQLFADEAGPQLFYDEVIENLRSWDKREPKLELGIKYRLLSSVIDIFEKNPANLKLEKWTRTPDVFTDLWRSDSPDHRDMAREFQHRFIEGDPYCLFKLRRHTRPVCAVAISPVGKRMVSGSRDNSIQIWNPEAGKQVGGPLQGHTGLVRSVAVSPDGKRIASGSFDNTIRIWDMDTREQVGEPLRGHEDWVRSVAFSGNKRIVSGADDNTIRIWDVDTGTQVGEPLQGHTSLVLSVAVSGNRIVSGSSDNTIQIWDLEKGVQVGEPLKGHQGPVWAVSISPDGKNIVSGSDDETIRIWDLETGKQIGEPLRGHENFVLCIALSGDGKHIVSGSADNTIRIWDSETGLQVGEPLRGHHNWVRSVAISLDNKRIVSGSYDETVRIWSAEGLLNSLQ